MSNLQKYVLGACICLLATQASAAPHFSGPSVAQVNNPVEFRGKGFTPNSAVTVVVASERSGIAASYGAVVAPDGSLRYVVRPQADGLHTVTVNDSGGRPLVVARLNVQR